MENQKEAVKVNDVLKESFLVDGEIVYPEEYDGFNIEDNRFIIELISDDEAMRQKYEVLLGDFDCVEFTPYVTIYNIGFQTRGTVNITSLNAAATSF